MNLETLAARQIDKLRTEREQNRELALKHMPEFVKLVDQLRAAGLGGRVVKLEIHAK